VYPGGVKNSAPDKSQFLLDRICSLATIRVADSLCFQEDFLLLSRWAKGDMKLLMRLPQLFGAPGK
jgi:hypothetical protein